MATGTCKKISEYDIDSAGTYNLSRIICAGFITGSGKYIDIEFPLSIRPGLSFKSMELLSGCNYFLTDGSHSIDGNAVTQIGAAKGKRVFEISLPEQISGNRMTNVHLFSVKIVFT